jgi:DNA-binding NarL/FixJ family response regulator
VSSAAAVTSARHPEPVAGSNPVVVIAHEYALCRDILDVACVQGRLTVAANCATRETLLRRCAETHPDVVVVSDPFHGPIDQLVDTLLADGVRVIVLTGDQSPERLSHLLIRGVQGYMLHDTSPSEVATGVHAVARGAVAINHTVATMLVQQWRRLRENAMTTGTTGTRGLTPRETEVLAAMVEGLPTKSIARRLGVAFKTIENHKIRIFEKLGVRTHAQAVSVAVHHGLVPPLATEALAVPDPAGV